MGHCELESEWAGARETRPTLYIPCGLVIGHRSPQMYSVTAGELLVIESIFYGRVTTEVFPPSVLLASDGVGPGWHKQSTVAHAAPALSPQSPGVPSTAPAAQPCTVPSSHWFRCSKTPGHTLPGKRSRGATSLDINAASRPACCCRGTSTPGLCALDGLVHTPPLDDGAAAPGSWKAAWLPSS